MSKFCPNCGKPLQEGKIFCPSCGTKVVMNSSVDSLPNNIENAVSTSVTHFQSQAEMVSINNGVPKQSLFGKFLSWRGRISRGDWIIRKIIILIILMISILVPMVTISSIVSDGNTGISNVLPCVLIVLVPFCFLSSIALDIKRCHDTDKSGDFLWVGCIPFYGWIKVPLCLWFKHGTTGANKYGPDPLA
ncbi:DUF805 domain-containing protein [Pectinatus cerevisiiphilus]|uniref:Uncharacterized membrane protein YhaH (DUF805 family) n=1 Tax=Pectinatus cerevisiiphilus TaxID=86956 RepID=A0A4R3KE81_9FIRM|nr:DUF805 domain-containing protein [Pectinatus cerevisiiphilus]TCS81410.1 uncharacterized membrane protein YhaH (DUF805 family) [Pectinatus cerevisiiphilus]